MEVKKRATGYEWKKFRNQISVLIYAVLWNLSQGGTRSEKTIIFGYQALFTQFTIRTRAFVNATL
jgi:hypothetical protein